MGEIRGSKEALAEASRTIDRHFSRNPRPAAVVHPPFSGFTVAVAVAGART
jgi:hypothetical protein